MLFHPFKNHNKVSKVAQLEKKIAQSGRPEGFVIFFKNLFFYFDGVLIRSAGFCWFLVKISWNFGNADLSQVRQNLSHFT